MSVRQTPNPLARLRKVTHPVHGGPLLAPGRSYGALSIGR
jgi:hypothetical protein